MLTQQFLEIRENLKIALLNEALIKNPESQTKLKAMNPIHMILVGGGKVSSITHGIGIGID